MVKLAKIERYFLYILLFLIPFQTRFIFGQWAPLPAGWLPVTRIPFIEWTSGFLYLSDIFILALLLIGLVYLSKNGRFRHISVSDYLLAIFICSAIASLFYAKFQTIAAYQAIKIIEFGGFYFYMRFRGWSLLNLHYVFYVISVSAFLQSIIAILQSFFQRSLGLRFLSESPLALGQSGVATFMVNGELFLRSYGAMPHPNILAFFLAAVSIIGFYFLTDTKNLIKRPMMIMHVVIVFGLLLTFARVIIAAWLFFIFIFFAFQLWLHWRSSSRSALLKRLAIFLVPIGLFCVLYWPHIQTRFQVQASEEAVTERVYFNKQAIGISSDTWWRGIGIGQFVPSFMQTTRRASVGSYQPVHNVYLLIWSELGLLGVAAPILFLAFIFMKIFKKTTPRNAYGVVMMLGFSLLLAIGLADHFWWTLQQGKIIFWLSLAYINRS